MKSILSLAIAAASALAFQGVPNEKTASPSYKDVQQIFNENCIGCHGGEGRARAGVNLTSYDLLMQGGEDGPIVKKGAPKHSLLIQALRGLNGVRHMPPRRDPLPEEKIAFIEQWILAGAKPK